MCYYKNFDPLKHLIATCFNELQIEVPTTIHPTHEKNKITNNYRGTTSHFKSLIYGVFILL